MVRRREFLAAPLALGARARAANDKLNIAGIGVGGMGAEYLKNCESENIAALCDVDDAFAAKTFARYPNARRYRDYRVLLEKEKGIDAVVIGTPDHSHAAIALAAIALGKHVYCAKPMTRTVEEARQLAAAARDAKVATQMSVQSSMSDGACAVVEAIQAGSIGAVREVHVWTDRPVWPQGLARPSETYAPPPTLDWKLWLAGAPERPYHPIYHPFRWRGWCDFGTGALGDMALHAFHVVFRAVGLKRPTAVHASSSFVMAPDYDDDNNWMFSRKLALGETFPHASIVTWDFPGGVRMHWYDGGLKPPRPNPEQKLDSSGAYYVGDKGVLVTGFSGGLKGVEQPPKTIPRTAGHYQEWIEAAKGGPPASCEFGFASLLTETALVGVAAIRSA